MHTREWTFVLITAPVSTFRCSLCFHSTPGIPLFLCLYSTRRTFRVPFRICGSIVSSWGITERPDLYEKQMSLSSFPAEKNKCSDTLACGERAHAHAAKCCDWLSVISLPVRGPRDTKNAAFLWQLGHGVVYWESDIKRKKAFRYTPAWPSMAFWSNSGSVLDRRLSRRSSTEPLWTRICRSASIHRNLADYFLPFTCTAFLWLQPDRTTSPLISPYSVDAVIWEIATWGTTCAERGPFN